MQFIVALVKILNYLIKLDYGPIFGVYFFFNYYFLFFILFILPY